MEASGQIQLFVIIIMVGMAMGILFDFYRLIRGIFRLKWFMTSLFDLLYWLLAVLVVFGVLLSGNWGEVRLYVFIALLIGTALYYRFFSRYTMRFMIVTVRRLVVIIHHLRIILLNIVKPFKFIVGLIIKPFVFIGRRTVQYYRAFRLKR